MLRSCRICQQMFDYCSTCTITKNPFKKAGYCCEDCYHISMILQRHSCNCATAEETVEALKPYNIESKTLQSDIQNHYQKILDSIKEEVIPVEDVEVVINENKDMTIS